MRDSDLVKWLADKPVGFWLTFCGAFLVVAARDAERAPWRVRIVKVITAALLGLGLHESVADLLSAPQTLTMAAIFIFGQIVLDTLSALLRDKDELIALVKALRGRK